MNKITAVLLLSLSLSCGESPKSTKQEPLAKMETVKLMTLDPGHFHAALVHKSMYPEVDSVIHIYAPEGAELNDFLNKVEGYNTRAEDPTAWKVEVATGADYLDRMIAEKPGTVMIVAGKNSKKIDYILAAVRAGLNVYADKPLVINPEGFQKLTTAFKIAEENGLMIYDIMTERFEATTGMQRLFSTLPQIFGESVAGSPEDPAISKESVHHFFKYVSGQPLVRPAWFFDVEEEGEGIVDVTTHLVDLVQWELFPDEIVGMADVEMISARRWPTLLSLQEFSEVTGMEAFPEFLSKDLEGDKLKVYCNGEMVYKIKGKYAKVSVVWNYRAPEGTGDTHYSVMRGTKSDLIIKQGAAEDFKPTLFIKAKQGATFDQDLATILEQDIAQQYPGTTAQKVGEDLWQIHIPEVFKIGHEAHFAQVTQNFLRYLKAKQLPEWEVPNMITKYYTTIEAYKMAKQQ